MVATPIGNLEDITLRAISVSCASATASSPRIPVGRARLLTHLDIRTRVESFHAHSSDKRVDELVESLRGGAHFALVTDAGTPLVSDPGSRLVAEAIRAGVVVVPIPGASAPLAAISACGLRVDGFTFIGFLPRAGRRRREAIDAMLMRRTATVLFEAPARLPKTLRQLASRLGAERPASVARELTKVHEEILTGTLGEMSARFDSAPRGEITVVVEGSAGAVAEPHDPAELVRRARELREEGLGTKAAARQIAEELGGLPPRGLPRAPRRGRVAGSRACADPSVVALVCAIPPLEMGALGGRGARVHGDELLERAASRAAARSRCHLGPQRHVHAPGRSHRDHARVVRHRGRCRVLRRDPMHRRFADVHPRRHDGHRRLPPAVAE